jgi:ankyrin repeat protein
MDASAPDDNGGTPLHFAAQASAADVARVLLDAGARIDARDSEGNTPLFRAVFASRGHGDVIELLRARGADPTIRNNHGVSPIDLSRTIANYNVRQFFADLPGHSDG